LPHLLAFAIGIAVGWCDFRMQTDDNLPSVALIGVPCLLFGLLWPRHAWRWGLAIGIGVPLWHFVGSAFGYHAVYPVQPNLFATFLALVPALIASYVGARIRSWTGARPAA
jgi:hypothetical protein